MRVIQFQTNFSVGELDPLIRARTDLQQYQNALEEATNVIIQPQGGFRRRDGLQFIYDFGGTFTDFKIIPFEFSVNDSYLLVLVNQRIYVFKAGVLQTNINASGNDYIAATDITAAMLDEINYTQAVDTLILCHEDLQTKRLVRNSDTSWTLENLPLTNLPQYAYAFDTHQPDFTITPSATSGNITITASAATTDTGTAQAGGADTITLKSSSSFTSDDQPNGMFITLTSGTGSGQTRHVEDYVTSTKVLTVYPAWDTAPDNTTGYKVEPFAAAAVGEYAQVISTFGRARYVEFVSSTEMKAVVEVNFFDASGITAGNWESEHGYEDVWSSTRGWPKSAAFHEGRLYFGGSKSRQNTIWGSNVINYFDFNPGTGLADEAVEATINTNQLNSIVNLFSGNDLRIFTTGGEFAVIQTSDDPITPSSFFIRPQTRLGSKPGVPVEDLNGASVFIQRQGKSLNAFQFGDTTASYQVQPLSALSSHLLKDPIDLAARRAASTDESDRLFVVNGTDGSMAVYSILVGQNVIAPSRFTTDGEFIAVGVEVSDVYTIVKAPVMDWNTTDGLSAAIDEIAAGTKDASDGGVYAWLLETVDSYPRADLGQNGVVGTLDAGFWESYGNGTATITIDANGDVTLIRIVYGPGPITITFTDVTSNNYIYARILSFVQAFWEAHAANESWVSSYITNTYHLQKFNPNLTLDRSVSGGAAGEVTSTGLRDRVVKIIRDGVIDGTKVASHDGRVDFATASTTSFVAGLDYTVTAKTMPAEPTLSSGSVQGFKKRIIQVDAIVNGTQNMTINGKQVPFRNLGENVLDKPVDPFTGTKTVHGLLGYSGTGQITVSQNVPLAMTVLGLEYRLSVGN
jgi:hypothetical protein